jgi:hypothetical protein
MTEIIKTKDEALKLLENKYGFYDDDGVMYKRLFAAFPDGYNEYYPGFAFLMTGKNSKTGVMEKYVHAIHVFPSGEVRSPSMDVGEQRLSELEIDWVAGTAKDKKL